MATPESKVKTKIKKILSGFEVWVHTPVSMGYGQHGIPDFVCCGAALHRSLGIFFAIEAKANGGKPTALQLMQMQRIRVASGVAFIIDEHNLQELEQWLQQYIRIK